MRLIGSIRRECLDHVIVFGERHLRHVLRSYQQYYNGTRTHLALASPRTKIASACWATAEAKAVSSSSAVVAS
jgi:hypothetical protein